MKTFLIVLLIILLLLIAIVVGAQNDQSVTVNYIIAQSELRLADVMALMLLFGIVISSVLYCFLWLRLRWRISQLERKQKSQKQPDLPA